ncbi:MafI family immunity protein [Planktothricoides raciborskii]|uniref:MafI family immunity protein n=1 Tax=Planktothricoides raciborskii FACHB-1370 TaxID=2949576 RepID=A0ABR8EL58_9CYAN|nr:MafI family immunity protein [Planktothricoides raciborskii]MBD2546824.1 MafI family immunity protein [Planktothricoides raciborskii FACHB-1370]MBD2585296.1 MafI family immunity protein [Planktothricoides raciborskii FACHB-1261]
MFDYKIVENKLNQALALVNDILSDNQTESIQSYIKAGEWNLAVETLCDILISDELPVNLKTYNLLEEAGVVLNMDRETWELLKVQINA